MDLGIYRLTERLGSGGMGEVWRAEDTRLLRQVAIKILPAELAADPEWKDRFLREARTIAQLNHPNIATIYAIGEEGDSLFIAMELVEGESLATLIQAGPMMPADAVRVAVHVADGLTEAHAKGIVHRDIKPENIIVSPRHVKVLDFGIAKHVGGGAAVDRSLTQGGMVLGTPYYMSPEQALGKPLDRRSDIFSLGVVLYEMLAGYGPFSGESITEILIKIVTTEPRDIGIAAFGITNQLADIVRRAMRKNVDERFASTEEMRTALAACLKEEPSRKRQSQVPTILVKKKKKDESEPRPDLEATPTVLRKKMPETAPAIPPALPLQPPAQPPAQTPVGTPRALVADDDPIARHLLGSVLAQHHIAFDEAANGADAVKFLKANDYTLAFVDLLMPRLDGWGVIDYVRARRGRRNPRLYVVTGVKDQKLSTADQDVVSGLIYKPIDLAQIDRLVTTG